MTIFDDALMKDKIRNLPKIYEPTKRQADKYKYHIKVKQITSVWINEKHYTDIDVVEDENYTYFDDNVNFQLFIYDNFYKLTKIRTYYNHFGDYYLNNGYLHNENGAALKVFDDKYYFINGKEISEIEFKRIIREKKLNRIIKPLD